jgi:hypothetical protein
LSDPALLREDEKLVQSQLWSCRSLETVNFARADGNYIIKLPTALRVAAERDDVSNISTLRAKAASIFDRPRTVTGNSYITERAARANIPKALRILKRPGIRRAPIKGDEVSRSARAKR